MLRLAANLSTLFCELPLERRFAAAAAAGFGGVEIQFPYELAPSRLRALLDHAGVTLALFNAPPGDLAAGERGLAGLPGREADFLAAVDRALEYAAASGCRLVHVMAGLQAGESERARQLATFAANLSAAAGLAAQAGVTLLLEPINTRVDVPGYLLDDTDTAVDLIRDLGLPNLGLQFDFYHQQIMAGDLARRFDALLPLIRHVQLADNPGRHEPGTGEIRYEWLLPHIAESAYSGWVGCEYRPRGDTLAGLGWASAWL